MSHLQTTRTSNNERSGPDGVHPPTLTASLLGDKRDRYQKIKKGMVDEERTREVAELNEAFSLEEMLATAISFFNETGTPFNTNDMYFLLTKQRANMRRAQELRDRAQTLVLQAEELELATRAGKLPEEVERVMQLHTAIKGRSNRVWRELVEKSKTQTRIETGEININKPRKSRKIKIIDSSSERPDEVRRGPSEEEELLSRLANLGGTVIPDDDADLISSSDDSDDTVE